MSGHGAVGRALAAAVLASLAAAPGVAQQGVASQLARGVERKLIEYGIRVDGAELSDAQLSALHLLLSSEGPMGAPGQKRIRVERILERDGETRGGSGG